MLTLVLFDMYEVLRWGWLYIINKIKRAKEMNSQQMNMHHLQYANLVIKLQFQRNERNNEIPTYWMCIIQQWNCLLFFKFFFLFFFFFEVSAREWNGKVHFTLFSETRSITYLGLFLYPYFSSYARIFMLSQKNQTDASFQQQQLSWLLLQMP